MENTDCLKIPGYDFWIESDGKRVKQYQVKETNESGNKVVLCYIASEVGKEFSIGIKNHENSPLTLIKLYLNDDCVTKRIYGHLGAREEFISHIYTAENKKQKFTFMAIRFEEDEHTELTTIPQNLGTITAEVFRVVNLRYNHSAPPRTTTLNTPTLLSEKSKTVGCHTVSLLKPEAVSEVFKHNKYSCDRVDLDTPWYTIKFLYRPLDILQAEGIAPLPAPNPTHNEDGDRGETRMVQQFSSEFHSKEDRKSAIRTIKLENSMVNGLKATGSKEPIIIEDSDEDVKYLPNHATTTQCAKVKVEEHVSSSKRSGETLDLQAPRKKRDKKGSDPVIIVVDSD